MGVRKRKAQGGPGGEASPAGSKRARKEEFTGARFKAQLREPQGAGAALETFVSAAKALPSEDVYDVVEGYIKISVECAEIFQLLSGEKRPESEMLLIFQALEAVLLRTASDLSHLQMVGAGIVKKLLNSHMKLLCEALYASGYRMARACLNLLTAMVAQGAEAARDVSSLFDLNKKTLYSLVTKRDLKGASDVRQAYVQFALSFLVTGDSSTVVQVLELKEFIPCIFGAGIKEDRISTINILLSTLKTKVVQNKSITKTQKVRFFTGQLLQHIASLYNWNGAVDVHLEGGKAAAADAGKRMVRELVHAFLLDLCCSLKHGINFYDATLGTSGRGGNLTLLHLLLGLRTAPDDELVAELVVGILRVCPDLLNKYFKEVTFSFLPRAQAAWTNNIRLLSKIYEAQPDISRAFQTRDFIPLPRLLAMVLVTTAPLVCSKTMFTQALNLDSRSVKHTALSLLLVILRRALKTVEFCQSSEGWAASGVYTAAMMDDFVRLFREALSKIFPDLNTIVWVWQSLVKHETKQDDPKAKKRGEQAAPGPDDAETVLLKAALLQVICLYQKVVPHVVLQYNFDFSKLLRGIISEQGVRAEVPPVLQHHILQVALELPASKFLWLKAQEGPEAEIIGGDRSVFYLLMKMFVTSSHAQLQVSTKLLIIKILRDTGVFEHTWRELELWLDHLDATTAEQREAVIQFLERVLLTVVAHPFVYTDKASDFVQEASSLQASLTKQGAADDVSLPISHIDDVLDMVDVLVEGSEGLDEEIGLSLSEDVAQLTFPFSAVVPAALQARNRLLLGPDPGAGAHVVAYLTAVLTDLLHSQRDPLALCLLLQSYDQLDAPPPPCCPQLPRFRRYYSRWIPEAARGPELPAMPESPPQGPPAASFPALLQAAYEQEGALLGAGVQAQLRAALPGLPLHQGLLAARHLLLYVRSTVDSFGQLGRTVGPAQLQLLLDLLRDLVVHCARLDTQRQQECAAAQASADTHLFLDMEAVASLEGAEDKTLEEVLTAVLRHPTLEGWYLALEQQALPPHGLGPVLVKLLAARLSAGVLQLLLASAPVLQRMGQLDLLDKYSAAVVRGLQEALRRPGRAPLDTLPQLEALRGLHPFLGAAPLHELTLALLDLPEARLLAPDAPGRPLNALGQSLVLLLERGPRTPLPWAAQHVRGMARLLPTLAAAELDAALLRTLQSQPELLPAAGPGLLDACLARPTPSTLDLATLLLRRGAAHRLRFELWCGRERAGPQLRARLQDFLPLVHAYLQGSAGDPGTRPRAAPAAAVPVLRKILWKRLQARLLGAVGTSETPQLHCEVLAQLVAFAGTKKLADLMDRLPDVLQAPGGLRSWVVADSISSALAGSAEQLRAWKATQLGACVRWLVASFSAGQPKQDPDGTRDQDEASMLRRVTGLLDVLPKVEPRDWQAFVKTGLRFRYQEGAFLQALYTALPLLYPPRGPARDPPLLPLPQLHAMVTQHSLFLPTLLTTAEEGGPDEGIKEALVDLMRVLVRLCPSVCESGHFAVLLGAYGASLSALDQKILLLLRAYEQNHLSLVSFRVLLWGPAAVDHHKTCRSLGKSLWQEPSVGDILRLLDPDRMMATILRFPQNRRLLPPEDSQDPVFRDKSVPDPDNLYDPCFLIHLFSELTRPEFVVDCRKFLDSNALGLTVAALSSYDAHMRAVAYAVLAAYYSHVEGARFREQPQVLYLLDVVRNGIRTPNMRLTFTLALFIAKAARQVLKPEEHMYMKLSKFLLSHQSLHMGKIPGFFQFFYSSDFEQRAEREWALELLHQGLRDRHCYELYSRRGVLRILLAFFNSPLCDPAAQICILEILQSAAQAPKPAYEILRDYSLLTWILHILESQFLETPVLAAVISLLQGLWETNLGDKGGAVRDPQVPPKHLPLQLVSEFLYVLTALTRHLRPALAPAQLTGFLGTLESVLRYRAVVLRAFRELGRFTVDEAALSTGDVLLLLHRWALLGRDATLQEGLRAAAETLPPGRLPKLLKDVSKSTGPARARGPRGRKRRPGDEEAGTAPELQAASVGTCQGLLRAILTHWAPVVPGPEPVDGAAPERRAAGPEHTVASLAASWALRSVAGCPPDAAEAEGLLGWLEKHILPWPAVVAELLADGTAVTSLFGLYTRLCGADVLAGPSLGVACQFNAIMLRLLAARGLAGSPVHGAIEGLCCSSLHEGEETATRAPAAFLVSLYIKDMWLGAPRPDTLLTHVQMVCDTATADEEEAIVQLCRTLQASTPNP